MFTPPAGRDKTEERIELKAFVASRRVRGILTPSSEQRRKLIALLAFNSASVRRKINNSP